MCVQKGVTELSIKLETFMGYGKGERSNTSGWTEVGVKKKTFSGKKQDFNKFTVGSSPPPRPTQGPGPLAARLGRRLARPCGELPRPVQGPRPLRPPPVRC